MSTGSSSLKFLTPWDLGNAQLPTVLERYRILGTIGRGGMGIVFKAFHLSLERHVAIKTLRIDKISTPELVNRFRQEIKLVGQMDHDHVVRATDAGERNGVFYLVMEYLPGRDLDRVVACNGPLSAAAACELVRQTALGLEYIHQKLVHRDIKPSNLMLTSTGQVKILDLGLAHGDFNESEELEQTPAGYAVGTRSYMAPEQAQGSRAIDRRADLYSLGCTLFKLLTGKAPYSGPAYNNTAKMLYAHCHVPLTEVPAFEAIPEPLRPILLRMTAKHPDDRYQTGREIAEALAPFAEGGGSARLLSAASEGDEVQPLKPPLPEELSRLTQSVVDTPHGEPTVSMVSSGPRRSRTGRRPAVALMVYTALGLGFLAVALLLLLRENPPESGLDTLDNSPPHSVVHLLRRKPFPVGFNFNDPRSGSWNRAAERLDVPGTLTHFYLLGSTESAHYDFEAEIEQAFWTGDVGIFWGYREVLDIKDKQTPNVPFAQFQCLHILHNIGEKRENLYVAQRNRGTLHYSAAGNVTSSLDPPSPCDNLRTLSGKVRLKIAVAGNQLALVEVGGERIIELFSDASKTNQMFANDPYQGSLGLMTRGNAATFSDVRFVLKSRN